VLLQWNNHFLLPNLNPIHNLLFLSQQIQLVFHTLILNQPLVHILKVFHSFQQIQHNQQFHNLMSYNILQLHKMTQHLFVLFINISHHISIKLSFLFNHHFNNMILLHIVKFINNTIIMALHNIFDRNNNFILDCIDFQNNNYFLVNSLKILMFFLTIFISLLNININYIKLYSWITIN
jgi:hypothetical protein